MSFTLTKEQMDIQKAAQENVHIDVLISELLSKGLNAKWGYKGHPKGPRKREERLMEGHGSKYHGIMEDKANFLEYVRNMEKKYKK